MGGFGGDAGGGGTFGGSGPGGGGAGPGCNWPSEAYPVSGSGFDAYEGVDAVEVLTPHQICPPGAIAHAPIQMGRFALGVAGYGSVFVFLDINGDGVYQKNEPDWIRTRGSVTPADFDAEKDFHVGINTIPRGHETQDVNIAFCTNADAVYGSADGGTCSLQRFSMGTTPSAFSADGVFESKNVSWAVWFTEQDVEPFPFDRSRPHFVGRLDQLPCVVHGDLTTCTLDFKDLITGGG
jgi:hypothetical protein